MATKPKSTKSEESDEDAKTPILKVPGAENAEPPKKPPRPRPSFVTNRDYVPSLMVFATFVFLVFGVQWMSLNMGRNVGFFAALAVFVFMAEWERRARYSLGRIRQRAHFDPLNLVKLPKPMIPPNIEMEPPTPWIDPEKKARTDPLDIVKRAEATLSGGTGPSSAADAPQTSAIELALINVLKAMAAQKEKEKQLEPPPPPPPSPETPPGPGTSPSPSPV